jgi:hypothetical protein
VQLHATVGTPQDMIAALLDIDPKTLRLHYRSELDNAAAQANAVIGGALFNKAKAGDVASMIFWMKARAGWRETVGVVQEKPEPPSLDLSKMSDEALRELADARIEPDDEDLNG